MDYLATSPEIKIIESMPQEGFFRRLPIEQFVSRLRTERSLQEAGLVPHAGDNRLVQVVIALSRAPGRDLISTLASLSVSSHPSMRVAVLIADGQDAMELRKFIAKQKQKPAVTEVWTQWGEAEKRATAKCSYAIFLNCGDQLHPSALMWLAIKAAEKKAPLGVIWGMIQPDETGQLVWAQRNGLPAAFEHWHLPALSNAIAAPAALASKYPGDLADELLHNDLHLFQLWLRWQKGFEWTVHPELFLIRAPRRALLRDHTSVASRFRRYEGAYRAFFKEAAPNYRFVSHSRDAYTPYHITPKREAGTVSVIIPFRDRADLTTKAVRSIWSQEFEGYVEVILVDNQSSAGELEALRRELKKAPSQFSSKIVSYNKPFNHSAQCNMGIDHAMGEVVVFLNNDCTLISRSALDEMVAWATVEGIGTVGVALRDPEKDQVTTGIEARINAINHFDSIVEENSTEFLTYYVRETFGNTFACAALSRRNFRRFGPLDEIRFPNGYNDVEYNCRLRKGGLRHVSLGHVLAEHAPGQSRSKTDESAQKILMRLMYPDSVSSALLDTRDDTSLARLAASKASPKASTLKLKSAMSPPNLPISTALRAKRLSAYRRFLSRIAESRVSQRILANPTAYRVVRRAYKLLVRS